MARTSRPNVCGPKIRPKSVCGHWPGPAEGAHHTIMSVSLTNRSIFHVDYILLVLFKFSQKYPTD